MICKTRHALELENIAVVTTIILGAILAGNKCSFLFTFNFLSFRRSVLAMLFFFFFRRFLWCLLRSLRFALWLCWLLGFIMSSLCWCFWFLFLLFLYSLLTRFLASLLATLWAAAGIWVGFFFLLIFFLASLFYTGSLSRSGGCCRTPWWFL